MAPVHHQHYLVREWLDNIDEGTPVPVPRLSKPGKARHQRLSHRVNENRTRAGLMHRKCNALRTARALANGEVLQDREEHALPNPPGVQPAFCSNHAFGEGEGQGLGLSQLDASRKKARTRGSSDSSILGIASGDNCSLVCDTKKVRVDRHGKLGRCAEGSGSSSLSRPREAQNPFERRPRHMTRKDLYDPKPPKRKRRVQCSGKTKRASNRPSGKGKGDALHQSFASKAVSKERLSTTVLTANPKVPDLAFSEMQFLHARQKNTNSRLHERLDEKEWRSKDRDIERHGKVSSYFSTTQRTLEEDPSTFSARKRIPPSKDRGGREIYRTPSEAPLTHSTSESAPGPSLERVPSLEGASVSSDQRPSTVVGSDGDTVSEVTSKFAWSISNRSEAPLDVSANGNLARITGSPFPKVAADKERIIYGATHERNNQNSEIAPEKGGLATHVRRYSRVDRGVPVDRNGAFGKGAIVEESGLPIPDTDSQSRPRTTSWMGSRTDGQHALDLDSDGTANKSNKSNDQSSPPSATVLRDCEIPARIPWPRDIAEDSLIAAAPCGAQVHLGQRARPTAELAASTTGAPIGVGPDTQRAGLVARPQSGPSEEVGRILSTTPLPAWGGGHQYGGPNYSRSSGLIRLRRGKENINRRLQPPSPYVSRPAATERAPFSSRKSLEGSSNELHSRSAVQQYLTTRVQKDAPGDPLLSNSIEDLGDIPWLRSCIALGAASVDMVESGHSQQSRYRDNSLVNPNIYGLDHIPNNTVSVSSADGNNDDGRAEQYCSEPYSTMHGDSGDLQPEDPRTESRFLEDASLGIRGFRWDQGQRHQDKSTIRRDDAFQTQTDAVIGMSMGTFWRPHRLY